VNHHYYSRKRVSISETQVVHGQTFCAAAVKEGQKKKYAKKRKKVWRKGKVR
jgi:hypothetical protein